MFRAGINLRFLGGREIFDFLPLIQDDRLPSQQFHSANAGRKTFGCTFDLGKKQIIRDFVVESRTENLIGLIVFASVVKSGALGIANCFLSGRQKLPQHAQEREIRIGIELTVFAVGELEEPEQYRSRSTSGNSMIVDAVLRRIGNSPCRLWTGKVIDSGIPVITDAAASNHGNSECRRQCSESFVPHFSFLLFGVYCFAELHTKKGAFRNPSYKRH